MSTDNAERVEQFFRDVGVEYEPDVHVHITESEGSDILFESTKYTRAGIRSGRVYVRVVDTVSYFEKYMKYSYNAKLLANNFCVEFKGNVKCIVDRYDFDENSTTFKLDLWRHVGDAQMKFTYTDKFKGNISNVIPAAWKLSRFSKIISEEPFDQENTCYDKVSVSMFSTIF